ncbi:IS66 family transposase [Sphaerochaeta pleomorpha]|uniref:IS66 family transposase n=1 Tax=Sphaerochaeta pleomorpha TaxID=1131707 RepID=UPI003CCAC771
MCSATPHKPAAYFQYDLSRSSDVLKGMVGEYNGYLQADADAGYQTSKQDYRFTLCLCAAHLRRKFVDAQKAGAYKQGSPGYITLERKIPPVKPSSQALFYQKYQTDYMFFTLLICLVSVLKSIQQKTRIGFCC